MSVQDASLLTIGEYPTTMSASDLRRVISLMLFFNAIPSQPSREGDALPLDDARASTSIVTP
jgi:hypothetical protein